MPYISPEARERLQAGGGEPETVGELNFVLSQEINAFMAARGLSYTVGNEVMGVLSCLSLEVYRRLLAHYEDRKCVENGDVWSRTLLS
jgi:hypothetical protein